jgi:hypothetical protein
MESEIQYVVFLLKRLCSSELLGHWPLWQCRWPALWDMRWSRWDLGWRARHQKTVVLPTEQLLVTASFFRPLCLSSEKSSIRRWHFFKSTIHRPWVFVAGGVEKRHLKGGWSLYIFLSSLKTPDASGPGVWVSAAVHRAGAVSLKVMAEKKGKNSDSFPGAP